MINFENEIMPKLGILYYEFHDCGFFLLLRLPYL